jgi:hypothetical protein
MNKINDELLNAATLNTRQQWIASLWAALVLASAGAGLLGGYEAPTEPNACLVTSTWAEPAALH